MDGGIVFKQKNESQEDELERLISLLPKELQNRWIDQIEELEIDEAITFVQNIIAKREEAKEKIFTNVYNLESEVLQKEVRSVLRDVETTLGNESYFLGEGAVAKVYETPYAPHVCVKYIVNNEMLERHGNTMRQEADYLVLLDNFSVEGIRIPKIHFRYMSENVVCFGMEKVDGMSLDKIINDRDSCDFLEVITRQDKSKVLHAMKSFISKMHDDMKVVHRDLAPRNIMVDRNGVWYVIDFGKAKKIEIGDSSTDIAEETDWLTAENSIKELFAKIS